MSEPDTTSEDLLTCASPASVEASEDLKGNDVDGVGKEKDPSSEDDAQAVPEEEKSNGDLLSEAVNDEDDILEEDDAPKDSLLNEEELSESKSENGDKEESESKPENDDEEETESMAKNDDEEETESMAKNDDEEETESMAKNDDEEETESTAKVNDEEETESTPKNNDESELKPENENKTESEPENDDEVSKVENDDEETESKDESESNEKKSSSKDDVVFLDSKRGEVVSDSKRLEVISDTEWFSRLSSEELAWYKEHGPSTSHFEAKTIQCTGCSNQILNSGGDHVFRHPSLGVAICRSCKNYYENGEWSKDEEGYDVYCLWCGNGGEMILCDYCTHSFCKRCIQRNLGRRMLSEISNTDKWKCLLCHPNLIFHQRAMYHAFMQFQFEKGLSKRKSSFKKKQQQTHQQIQQVHQVHTNNSEAAGVAILPDTDNFLDDNMGEAFKTLSIYQKCLEDERRRWIKCKKRMDLDAAGAITRNLRKIYAITKQNMDLLDADLVQSFSGQFPGVSNKSLDVSIGVDNLVSAKKRKRDVISMPPTQVDEFIVNGSPVTAEYHGPEVDEEFDPSSLLQVEFRETSAVTHNKMFTSKSAAASSKNNDSDIEVLTLDSDDEVSSPPQPTKKRRPGPRSKTLYLD